MILIVDDDPALADNCAALLEVYGYATTVALSGREALDKIAVPDTHLDLLISDCTMPGINGMELSRRVRASAQTCMAPILLMSGSLECDIVVGDSYDAFMRKPFLAEALLAEVRRLLPHYVLAVSP